MVIVDPTALSWGNHTAQVTFTSNEAANSPFALPVSLTVMPVDTLSLSYANAFPGSTTDMQFSLRSYLPVDSLAIAIAFDDAAMRIDSVTAAGRALGKLGFSIVSSQSLGMTEIAIATDDYSSAIPAGNGPIANIYLTVDGTASEGEYPITSTALVTDSTHFAFPAHTIGGSIAVGPATPVYPVESPIIPTEFVLEQNYPNPFNATTYIPYALASSGEVTLEVLNILGQKVKSIHSGYQFVGKYFATWDGLDDSGKEQGTGIYFVRLRAAGHSLITKIVLLK